MTREHLNLLVEALSGEIEVVSVNGYADRRYIAARELDDAGYFHFCGLVGVSGPAKRRLRIRYCLTDEGERVARGTLS